ncbi:hypothetical protein ABZP36_030040 [Zizania latifolia]
MPLLAVVVAAAFATASGASYGVGEPSGSWDLQTNYTAWASSINFQLGDQLVFKYSLEAHDVVEVTKASYLSCSASSPISALRSGEDTIKLDRPGRRYFICGVPGHCDSGMKLQVRVAPPGCNSPPPPSEMDGTPGGNGTPGGLCLDGSPSPSPTIISTPGVISYNSAPGSSSTVSAALVIAATTMLLISMLH